MWPIFMVLASAFFVYSKAKKFNITARDWLFLFVITKVCFNQVDLCTKITNWTLKSIHYNRFASYTRVLLYSKRQVSYYRVMQDEACQVTFYHFGRPFSRAAAAVVNIDLSLKSYYDFQVKLGYSDVNETFD